MLPLHFDLRYFILRPEAAWECFRGCDFQTKYNLQQKSSLGTSSESWGRVTNLLSSSHSRHNSMSTPSHFNSNLRDEWEILNFYHFWNPCHFFSADCTCYSPATGLIRLSQTFSDSLLPQNKMTSDQELLTNPSRYMSRRPESNFQHSRTQTQC